MSQQLRPYDAMVKALFNTNPNNAHDNRMHAAVGIMGEVIELLEADSPENLIEECGDLEFYMEAYIQSAKLFLRRGSIAQTSLEVLLVSTGAKEGEAERIMLLAANELLDVTKKVWVYHKDPVALDETIITMLGRLMAALTILYSQMHIERDQVLRYNQEKLAKRYPDGVYSNLHAQSRLDKESALGIDSEGGSHD